MHWRDETNNHSQRLPIVFDTGLEGRWSLQGGTLRNPPSVPQGHGQVHRAQNSLENCLISRQHGGLIHKMIVQTQDDTGYEKISSQAGCQF